LSIGGHVEPQRPLFGLGRGFEALLFRSSERAKAGFSFPFDNFLIWVYHKIRMKFEPRRPASGAVAAGGFLGYPKME